MKTKYSTLELGNSFDWGEIVLYLFKDIAGYISSSGRK
jgi:hypothetical protein